MRKIAVAASCVVLGAALIGSCFAAGAAAEKAKAPVKSAPAKPKVQSTVKPGFGAAVKAAVHQVTNTPKPKLEEKPKAPGRPLVRPASQKDAHQIDPSILKRIVMPRSAKPSHPAKSKVVRGVDTKGHAYTVVVRSGFPKTRTAPKTDRRIVK